MLNLLGQAASASDPNMTNIIANPVETANQVVTYISQFLAAYGLKVVGAIVIFIVGRWVARLASGLVAKAMKKAKADLVLVSFAENIVYIGLLVMVVIAALSKVGVETTSFAATIAAAGLAVGLALQGSLSNFAAGVLMIIFRPVRVGDFVEVGGAAGTVKEVQIFTTILASPDNVRIIVPNAQVLGGNIKNYTVNGTRRVDMVIGVSYDDDLKETRAIIEKVIGADERVLPEPAPLIAVSELGDSSVNFVVRPWVNGADYWAVRFDLIENIKVALEAGGITIPFPQRDVHMITPTGSAS
ncbi:mechanosensitive ion channel family protein [Planctomycetota bacterium]